MKRISTFLVACIVLFGILSLPQYISAQVTGVVYNDHNADGTFNSVESGHSGVVVNAYDSSNTLVSSATTTSNGSYTLDLPDGDYRLEFTNLANAYPVAGQAISDIVLISSPADNVDLGVLIPGEYCEADPQIVIPCYINGDPTVIDTSIDEEDLAAEADVLVSFPYGNEGTSPSPEHVAVGKEMGAVWGLAYSSKTQKLYSAAVTKRHAGFGPLGTGGIYVTDFTTVPPNTQDFLDINGIMGVSTGSDTHTDLPADKTQASSDVQTFDAVGKISLGDMDISNDGNTLFVVNLNDRSLHAIDISNGTPGAADITTYNIPNPNCSDGDFRPWGVKYYRGSVYIGVVCSAETSQLSSDLEGNVYALDLSTGTFDSVLNFPLDFAKGCTDLTFGCEWNPWTNDFNDLVTGVGNKLIYPQPLITDIEFDTNGDMILGLMDRTGHQTGRANVLPGEEGLFNGFAGGDILRASPITNDQFDIESNGTVGGVTGCGADNGDGPGGGEYYCGDDWNGGLHEEVVVGGLAVNPSAGEVVASVFDPVSGIQFAGGVHHYDNATGERNSGYLVYQNLDPGTFGKATGIGDVELLCGVAPTQIGSLVWEDANGNGVQDAGESGIAGVTITLLDEDGNFITSTQTNENGEYAFTDLDPNTTYQLVIELGMNVGNFPPSPLNNATGDNASNIDSNGDPSMSGGNVMAVVTTGDNGENDLSIDFGFVSDPCTTTDLSVSDVQTTDVACADGGQGSITITVSGGNAPYQYSTDGGATYQSESMINLDAGDYNLMVMDDSGCTAEGGTYTIDGGSSPSIDSVDTTPISCDTGGEGTITINASGGTAPYTYSINDGVDFSDSNTYQVLAGSYTIIVRDANGCETAYDNSNPIQIEAEAAPTIENVVSQITTCGASDGQIQINVVGGTPPYQYSIDNGNTYSDINSFSNLGGGLYDIVVLGTDGCAYSGGFVQLNEAPAIQISEVLITNIACANSTGGTITINASGGVPPLQYSIDGGTTYQSSNTFTDLAAASYQVSVNDPANACTTNYDDTVSITDESTDLNITVTTDSGANCNDGGTISISADGGSGNYEYSIDGGANYAPENSYTGLQVGTYSIYVWDVNTGCTYMYDGTATIETVNCNSIAGVNDLATTACGTPITINVIENDYDPDGDPFSLTEFTQAPNGTVIDNGNGVLTYTPNDGFSGEDTFSYIITDDLGHSGIAYVTVTVEACDNNSIAGVNDLATTACGTPITINVTENDYDPDGDPFSLTEFTQAPNGTVTDNGNGVLTYTPNDGFSGEDTFSYIITDDLGHSGVAYVTVTVEACNNNSIAGVNDLATTACDTPITINVTENDYDPDGDAFSLTEFTQAPNGTVTDNGNGVLTYTPNSGFYGQDTFSYIITDELGHSGIAYVTITVEFCEPVCPAEVMDVCVEPFIPTAICPEFCTLAGEDYTIYNVTADANCGTEVDGPCVIYTSESYPLGFMHTMEIVACITGNLDVCETVNVNIQIGDCGECEADAGTLVPTYPSVCVGGQLSASAVNQPVIPTGYELLYVLTSGSDLTIESASASPNFTVAETGEYTIHSLVYHATTIDLSMISTGGQLNSLLLQGGGLICGSLLVEGAEFSVVNCNTAPDAVDDSVTTPENTPITISVLPNDSDPDGDILYVCNYTLPANGTITLVNDQFIYTPNDGFTGVDVFTYTICDGNGNEDTAVVTITVNPSGPCENPIQTACTMPITPIILCPDYCALGDDYEIVSVNTTYNCGIAILPEGCVRFTPLPGYLGIEEITINACAGDLCDAVVYQITVVEDCENITPNSAPVAQDDTAETNEGIGISIISFINDSDADGDDFNVTEFTQPTNGTITNDNGVFTYFPNAGFSGDDSFTYTICDSNGACDTATITVTVVPLEDCTNPAVCVEEATPIEICVNFCEVNSVSITNVTTLYNCSISNTADNCFTYIGLPAFVGQEMLEVTACNTLGQCETVIIDLTVGNCDGPVLQSESQSQKTLQDNEAINIEFFNNPSATNNVWWAEADIINTNDQELMVFNLNGQMVYKASGTKALQWNGEHYNGNLMPTGTYFYILQIDGEMWKGKMILGAK